MRGATSVWCHDQRSQCAADRLGEKECAWPVHRVNCNSSTLRTTNAALDAVDVPPIPARVRAELQKVPSSHQPAITPRCGACHHGASRPAQRITESCPPCSQPIVCFLTSHWRCSWHVDLHTTRQPLAAAVMVQNCSADASTRWIGKAGLVICRRVFCKVQGTINAQSDALKSPCQCGCGHSQARGARK